MTKSLRGVLTALATPFDADENVDRTLLQRLVDRSVDNGVSGVVACGSTGEVGALTVDERLTVVDTVVEHTAGRVPVIAQTGATSTSMAVRLSRAAQESGADVLMLVTPYYQAISVEETVAYVKDVASAVDLPIMIYNIPAATGVNLDPEVIRRLATDVERIRYVKDSSGDWGQALQLVHHHCDVIETYVGWDAYAFSALAEGAAGVTAGAANVVPAELVAVSRRIADGDLAGALELWKRLYPVIDAMVSVPFVPAVKAGLALRGEPVGAPRRPLSGLADEHVARLEAALASVA